MSAFSGYDSESGIVSETTSTTHQFDWEVKDGTTYYVGVFLEITLEAEANCWSSSGSAHKVKLDVSELKITAFASS
ncbi:MAG: hypothetical protein RTU30_16175 [Candidatus Thorarchaeota archaeon]